MKVPKWLRSCFCCIKLEETSSPPLIDTSTPSGSNEFPCEDDSREECISRSSGETSSTELASSSRSVYMPPTHSSLPPISTSSPLEFFQVYWYFNYDVAKIIETHGFGNSPNLPSKIIFHITGWLANEKIFQRETTELSIYKHYLNYGNDFTAKRLRRYLSGPLRRYAYGLLHVLAGMKRGERARVMVLPNYGYGGEGFKEFNLGPYAMLFYNIKIIDYTNLTPILKIFECDI